MPMKLLALFAAAAEGWGRTALDVTLGFDHGRVRLPFERSLGEGTRAYEWNCGWLDRIGRGPTCLDFWAGADAGPRGSHPRKKFRPTEPDRLLSRPIGRARHSAPSRGDFRCFSISPPEPRRSLSCSPSPFLIFPTFPPRRLPVEAEPLGEETPAGQARQVPLAGIQAREAVVEMASAWSTLPSSRATT